MADEGKHAAMWAKQHNSANIKAHIATLEHCIHTMRVELHKLSQELQIITTTTPPTTPHDKVAQEVRERAQTFEEEMWAQGYREVRQIGSGEWIGCMAFCYTAGLVVGLSDSGYRIRYCYATMARAVAAANAWNGHSHPPGPWIKMKGGADGDVFGPGATAPHKKEGVLMRDIDCLLDVVMAIGSGSVIGAFISAMVLDAYYKHTGGRRQ